MNQGIVIKNKADQVIDYVSNWIKSGSLSIGDRLPSERQLAKQLGVSLLTVNKAMSRLEDTLLISRSAGRGTHITNLPAPDTIAVICDICHLNKASHPSSVDILIDGLIDASKHSDMVPQFWIGKGETREEFLNSLGFKSATWNNIKGVVAMAWRDGVEEVLTERGIPLVTISTKNQGSNSVIFDYKALGRMGAKKILKDSPKEIYLIHNKDFLKFSWNSPVKPFLTELKKCGFDMTNIHCIPIEPSEEAGLKIGKQIGNKAKHIFFTDENIANGFAAWMATDSSGQDRHIVTQASSGLDTKLPESFDKLTFIVEDVCKEALKLLKKLRASGGKVSPPRRFVKPVLFKRQDKK